MDNSKKQTAIFYIEKNKGILYTANSVTPFICEFDQDAIIDLEVVDKDKFEKIISGFIAKNELKPMNIFVVLTREVTFEKELKNIPFSLQSAETEKFLEMSLFEHILTKTYNLNNKTIIVIANRDFCENIVNAFAENLFSVLGVIPLSILEEKIFPDRKDFKQFVLKKIENLRQYFLPLGLEQQEKTLTYNIPSLKNAQFVVLLGIFALLLIILGIQVYSKIFPKKPTSYQLDQAVVKKVMTPTPIAIPSAILISPTQTPKKEQ